jgi:hypothetical protein
VDHIDSPNLDTAAWSVAVAGGRVFVAGTTRASDGSTPADSFLRAYNARSGALLWHTTLPHVTAYVLKVRGDRAIVAGLAVVGAAGSATNRSYIGAFGVESGTLLWEDQGVSSGSFNNISVDGDHVVATGRFDALILRVYNASTGARMWETRQMAPSGFADFSVVVASNGKTVYLGGSRVRADNGPQQMLVQAWDEATGALLWEDASHQSFQSGAGSLALAKNRLFAAGWVADGTSQDLVIRAYGIASDAPPDSSAVSD